MHATALQQYRERLLDERRQLIRDTDRILESILEDVHPPGEHEIAPSEGIDVETSLEKADVARLRRIDSALQRIKDGTYGRCQRCGRAIIEARLDAVPDALYCVQCDAMQGRD
jgi:RNA polymerase-binding protein DksA